ncbi:pimeloyl-ACP methyl ester carboxylesterase [Rhodococcus sp. 27YEA15]|uniref:alpha/beta fold hydrolase n=1 Tax=Rhodococcus sp. 27YEA15 TaxID=3156259 RepID=UPI003C7E9571
MSAPRSSATSPVTLVFTHGFGDSSRSWDSQTAGLSDRYEVKVWDLPGHGDHQGEVPLDCDIDSTATELDSIVADSSGSVFLIGHSIGGYISLRCALATSTHSIAGLVVISAGPGFRSAEKIAAWNSKMDRMTDALSLPPSASRVVYMTDARVMERLPSLATPTLVVRGSNDHEMYLSGSGYIAAKMPNAELLDISDAGHDPHRSHSQIVNSAIDRFVTRTMSVDVSRNEYVRVPNAAE